MSITNLTKLEKKLLDLLQLDFPLTSRPFEEIGKRLMISQDQVMACIKQLKNRKIIRQIGAIYNTEKIGFKSTLVGATINAGHIAEAAAYINQHPGVSHNYVRNHQLNLWFTIAVPDSHNLQTHLQNIRQNTAIQSFYCFSKIKVFKKKGIFRLSALKMPEKMSRQTVSVEQPWPGQDHLCWQVMQLLQQDLSIEPTPFLSLARSSGIKEQELFQFIAYLKNEKKMSRYAAILRNQEAGYIYNAMVVWKIAPETVAAFGEYAAHFETISHCYERTAYADWPYNLYTMIHSKKSRTDCEQLIQQLKSRFNVTDYQVLYSVKELKKARVDYFSRHYNRWSVK